MKNRFNLEGEINTIYSFAQQLESLADGILEYQLTNDEIVNVLSGLKVMLELHTKVMTDTMCQCFRLEEYKNIPLDKCTS